jgi:hypothetical protein
VTLNLDAIRSVAGLQTKAHYQLHQANQAFAHIDAYDPRYTRVKRELDCAAALLSVGKWRLGQVAGTHIAFVARTDRSSVLENAKSHLERSMAVAQHALLSLVRNPARLHSVARPALAPRRRREIVWAEGVPLTPTICPVVVLTGSSFQMGAQYAEQIVEIYGAWILVRPSHQIVSRSMKATVARWREPLESHAPEVIDFARGWAAGARRAGVRLSFLQALMFFTGSRALSESMLAMGVTLEEGEQGVDAYLGVNPLEQMLCTGACSWGAGTRDGSLVAGSTTDHDCTFQATIVAYPDDGFPFIYTPFSVTGHIPVLGQFYLAGHPGMNNQGLAYVHHGGGGHMAEPAEQWGYGLRRGASTLHALRYARSAREAREFEMSLPVGETNTVLGSAGGFYADAGSAYVLESRWRDRRDRGSVARECTRVGAESYDFLYANNNSLSDATRNAYANGERNAFASRQDQYFEFNTVEGWHVSAPARCAPIGGSLQRLITMSARSSQLRNRFFYERLRSGYGDIDVDFMTALYRTGARIPSGISTQAIARAFLEGGPLTASAAHRANAFTAIMRPARGDSGIYRACIGPARRSVAPVGHAHGYYYFDETAAFWELTLADTPRRMAEIALDRASHLVRVAVAAVHRVGRRFASHALVVGFARAAEAEVACAQRVLATSGKRGDVTSAASLARAIRHSTRAQVRAQQAIDAIDPPPDLDQLASAYNRGASR